MLGTVGHAVPQRDLTSLGCCSLSLSRRVQLYSAFTDEAASVFQRKFSKAVQFTHGGVGIVT